MYHRRLSAIRQTVPHSVIPTSKLSKQLVNELMRLVDYQNIILRRIGEKTPPYLEQIYRQLVAKAERAGISIVTAKAMTAEQKHAFLSQTNNPCCASFDRNGNVNRGLADAILGMNGSFRRGENVVFVAKSRGRSQFSIPFQDYITSRTGHCAHEDLEPFAKKSCTHYPCSAQDQITSDQGDHGTCS